MPEGAELTPVESDEESINNKLNIDLTDILISKPANTGLKEPKKKLLKKKKKNKQKTAETVVSSDEEGGEIVIEDTPVEVKSGSELIQNYVLIAENVDLAISIKTGSKIEGDKGKLKRIVKTWFSERNIIEEHTNIFIIFRRK
jgi:hypothetical protein